MSRASCHPPGAFESLGGLRETCGTFGRIDRNMLQRHVDIGQGPSCPIIPALVELRGGSKRVYLTECMYPLVDEIANMTFGDTGSMA